MQLNIYLSCGERLNKDRFLNILIMVKVNVFESYESPVVEVIEVEVEKGFAGSIGDNYEEGGSGEF